MGRDLGRAVALLAGATGAGINGFVGAREQREETAERRRRALFGDQLQSANATLAAREKGYVPQVSDQTRALAALTGDTSGLPGALAHLGGVANDTRTRMAARGTLQVPQPDGSLAELAYDPSADQSFQQEVREAARRNTERATERMERQTSEDRTREEANRGAYNALQALYANDPSLRTYDPATNYTAVGTGLQKREADDREARMRRELAIIAEKGRGARGGRSPAEAASARREAYLLRRVGELTAERHDRNVPGGVVPGLTLDEALRRATQEYDVVAGGTQPSGDRTTTVEPITGTAGPAGAGRSAMPAVTGAAPHQKPLRASTSAAPSGKPVITADQAAFLQERKGWTPEQIAARYEVR